MKKLIYDFGANNGDDIPYYLKKADVVIAVEANPELSQHIQTRFTEETNSGRLIVVSAVLTNSGQDTPVPFYIHQTYHALSQFPRPRHLSGFHEVYLPSRRAADIIREFGFPHYVKIDVEQYDHEILEDLFLADIRPEFISAEAHTIEVFASLVALGKYRFFKIVDGESVHTKFRNHKICTPAGDDFHSFPDHSAGPFGDDLPGRWLNPNELFEHLSSAKLGWKDIHAARNPAAAVLASDFSMRRNSLCYCGSGKKYKYCHGTLR